MEFFFLKSDLTVMELLEFRNRTLQFFSLQHGKYNTASGSHLIVFYLFYSNLLGCYPQAN